MSKLLTNEQLDHLVLSSQLLACNAISTSDVFDETDKLIETYRNSVGGQDFAITTFLQMQEVTPKLMDELITASFEEAKRFRITNTNGFDIEWQQQIARDVYLGLLTEKYVSTFVYVFYAACISVIERLKVFISKNISGWEKTAVESLILLPEADKYAAERIFIKMKNIKATGLDAFTHNCYYRTQNEIIHEMGFLLTYFPYQAVLDRTYTIS
jgi:hypothetical protein